MRFSKRALLGICVGAAATCVGACEPGSPTSDAAQGQASASASAAKSQATAAASAVPVAVPVSPDKVKAAINRTGRPPYSGPTGTVQGVITVAGDEAPALEDVVAKVPEGKQCDRAREVYGKLFREGSGRTLGDALVAVTGYDGFVPPKGDSLLVEASGCAFSRRTYALTFGQRVDVLSRDGETYIPQLLGTSTPALMVAMPGGKAVKLFPTKVGQYALMDRAHAYASADVFVLAYPTAMVTGIDGRYALEGIPVGKVRVSAFLPVTGQTVDRDVEVRAGEATKVDLTLSFDVAKHTPKSPR